jgi:steroid 5-alpha reductase family enzyme
VRLGLFVALRVASTPEDRRYVGLRQDWGAAFQGRLFGFIMIQAPVALLLGLTIMSAALNPGAQLGLTDWVGAAILAIAIGGEGLADEQMRRFKADPANHGKVCDVGLWGWSRHPNYFFEWFGWLAYPVIALPLNGGYWWGLAAWVAPVLMYLVLARGTGVPPLEAHMLKSRGQAFADYQARVSCFFPAPPRKHPS